MAKFTLREEQCDACGSRVPTTVVRESDDDGPRYCCEFCYQTPAYDILKYRPSTEVGHTWKAAASVANYLRFTAHPERAHEQRTDTTPTT